MHKDLLILCHPDPAVLDPTQRETVDRKDIWKRNAQRFGVWMASQDLVPVEVLCDDSLTSRTAAQKSCKAAGLSDEIVRNRKELGGASVPAFLFVLASVQPDSNRVLVAVTSSVGTRFCSHVCRRDADSAIASLASNSGGLLHLRLGSQWRMLEPGCGDLVQVIDPAKLPKTFPFPGTHGNQRRPRPAYDYRQSAVIPYRFRDGQLEVLVISTSKRKRWGVPKGIHDPGKTAQASAANEAMEEAGVLGEVLDIELGQYTYAKWGAMCAVRVYPMEVTEVLAPGDWPESHRGREWLSPLAAADRVHQRDLKLMIRDLPQRVATTR